jgi:GT2 family glycosyltransferase
LTDIALLKFSLIVLSYNSGAYIQRCLDALKPFGAEIVLADNGSADFNAESLRRANPDVKILPIGMNLGFAAGNNGWRPCRPPSPPIPTCPCLRPCRSTPWTRAAWMVGAMA